MAILVVTIILNINNFFNQIYLSFFISLIPILVFLATRNHIKLTIIEDVEVINDGLVVSVGNKMDARSSLGKDARDDRSASLDNGSDVWIGNQANARFYIVENASADSFNYGYGNRLEADLIIDNAK